MIVGMWVTKFLQRISISNSGNKMFLNRNFHFVIILFLLQSDQLVAQDPITYWNFDEINTNIVRDVAGNYDDTIQGHFKTVEGVLGQALKCDGFTTRIIREAENSPLIQGAFSVEAWVAPQAYPWNWCAIVTQAYKKQRGFFFGLDAEGRIGLHIAINRQWREFITEQKIPFMEWSYIVATFNPKQGVCLYINGKLVDKYDVPGTLLVDIDMDLQIARNYERTIPASLNRAGLVRIPASYSFDGLLDELKIYNHPLSDNDIKSAYSRNVPKKKPDLVWRKLPTIPPGQKEFGAFFTNLQYDDDWDRLWKVDSHPDIVVTFDNQDYGMVFWKGTNYNMNLVTEDGKWIADQSAEGGGPETQGCCEHMSDKQNRYTHVRLIENNQARVVVHWRYALTDVTYQIANVDPITDWGDWADEYYYIYPDGIAIRHFSIHGANNGYSITEPAIISNPGEKPEDNIDLKAVTLANLEGEERTYSFETWPTNGEAGADFNDPVQDATISIVNVFSTYKPFYIYEPGTRIIPYGGGIREIDYEYSHFHARNHWPVSMIPCDGRFVLAADRVTSSAITSPEPPMKRREKDGALEGRFIMGISSDGIDKLTTLAKYWNNPPDIQKINTGYKFIGFDKNERAYNFNKSTDSPGSIKFDIVASNKSPLVNPVFIIDKWGGKNIQLVIDDQPVNQGNDFRYDFRKTLEGTDLIIWLKYNSNVPVSISIDSID
jgi:hypothetical protein